MKNYDIEVTLKMLLIGLTQVGQYLYCIGLGRLLTLMPGLLGNSRPVGLKFGKPIGSYIQI